MADCIYLAGSRVNLFISPSFYGMMPLPEFRWLIYPR